MTELAVGSDLSGLHAPLIFKKILKDLTGLAMIYGKIFSLGEMAEWLKATVLKTVMAPSVIVGSNPSLSAVGQGDILLCKNREGAGVWSIGNAC